MTMHSVILSYSSDLSDLKQEGHFPPSIIFVGLTPSNLALFPILKIKLKGCHEIIQEEMLSVMNTSKNITSRIHMENDRISGTNVYVQKRNISTAMADFKQKKNFLNRWQHQSKKCSIEPQTCL